MMTAEEAVERVLAGASWVKCSACDEGLQPRPGTKGEKLCEDCKGFETVLDPEYIGACSILGKELPERRHPRIARAQCASFEVDKMTALKEYEMPLSGMIDVQAQQFFDAAIIGTLTDGTPVALDENGHVVPAKKEP